MVPVSLVAWAATQDHTEFAISIWEFSKLVEKGRLRIACDGEAWIEQAREMRAAGSLSQGTAAERSKDSCRAKPRQNLVLNSIRR